MSDEMKKRNTAVSQTLLNYASKYFFGGGDTGHNEDNDNDVTRTAHPLSVENLHFTSFETISFKCNVFDRSICLRDSKRKIIRTRKARFVISKPG